MDDIFDEGYTLAAICEFLSGSGAKRVYSAALLNKQHDRKIDYRPDFIGLDVCLSILEVMYEGFNDKKYLPSKLLVDMVNNGNLGVKSGEGFYDYSEGLKNKKVSSRFN